MPSTPREVSHHEWESVTLVTMSDSRFSSPSDENVEALHPWKDSMIPSKQSKIEIGLAITEVLVSAERYGECVFQLVSSFFFMFCFFLDVFSRGMIL